jgi:hypothetical protein
VVEGLSHTHEDVMEKRPDGLSVYSTVRFHERAGAEVIAAIPHCTKNDTESLCTGVLVVYDLQKLRQEGRI